MHFGPVGTTTSVNGDIETLIRNLDLCSELSALAFSPAKHPKVFFRFRS
jgi:hypothetical protein